MDLYLPKGRDNFPVLHFVHGGAWIIGNKNQVIPGIGAYRILGQGFASRGIGVAISNYRLAPEHKHPAQIVDVSRAWAWLYHNISSYGGDSSNLFLMGQSSGGHLVSLLSTDERYLNSLNIPIDSIKGTITMSGVYDLETLGPVHWLRDDPSLFIQQIFGNDTETLKKASPSNYVNSELPAFMVLIAENDPIAIKRQAPPFVLNLHRNNVLYDFAIMKGKNHITSIGDVGRDDDATTDEIEFFIKSLIE
ncbi:MAG: alpha/beta hydrolase [Opitutales bacterium]